jgi:FkbM family methyltransferase
MAQPNLREKSLAAVTRLYPFKSGCGNLANSGFLKALSGVREADVWAPVRGGRALVPLKDYVGRSMYFFADLDPKVSWLVDRYVRKGDVALDIGANLGVVSLRLASRVGPDGQVHAFEPNPAILKYLGKTLSHNVNLPIRLHRVALGSEEANLELSLTNGNAGMATLVGSMQKAVHDKITVPVRRLDTILSEAGVQRIDFIKIDVEGFEAQVLLGGREAISRFRPRAIILEEHGAIKEGRLPQSLHLLREAGYEIFGLAKSLMKVDLVPLARLGSFKPFDFVALRDG